ncbi:hypothetical protein NY78_0175 [Desulfovibrio sp. TomC]|nr:hypothetical protein NY78_0175 [Desulfovibrio sp. TomC]
MRLKYGSLDRKFSIIIEQVSFSLSRAKRHGKHFLQGKFRHGHF